MTSAHTHTPTPEDTHRTPNAPRDESGVPEGRRGNITTRVEMSVRVRVEAAAKDCSLTVSEWIREVVLSALELHESGGNEELVEVVERVGETDVEYEERVRAAAALERQALEMERTPSSTAKRFDDPKACPHLPQWRSPGGRCGGCGGRIPQGRGGSMVGPRLTSSIGGMVGPRL